MEAVQNLRDANERLIQKMADLQQKLNVQQSGFTGGGIGHSGTFNDSYGNNVSKILGGSGYDVM